MFLKSIDLFGFKSFAEKSHIDFTDGISALVGPNGCGKSNIVDAVKWVLGEQATRSLRADRMEDVIFNGTDSRKATNVAEVTLTLENNGVLPLDIPEVAIRRRLFRSGESEYFVNNAPVKLRELRELFYDTGVGKTAYSIMEQGRIDQILSTRAEDRRSLFEEAAGITRYKMRSLEADRKLQRTEENMREVQSVLNEVTRSYETLKSQAEKTSRYRQLRDTLFERELDLSIARLRRFQQDEEALERKISDREKEKQETTASIDRLNEHLEMELEQVNAMESRLVDIQKTLYGIEVERSSRSERMELLREQIARAERRIESERSRLREILQKAERLEHSAAEAEKSVSSIEGEVKEVETGIAQVEERIKRSQERRREARQTIVDAENSIAEEEKRIAEIQGELREVTDQLVGALDQKVRESGYSSADRRRAEEQLAQSLENHGITIRGRRDSLLDRVQVLRGNDLVQQISGDMDAIEVSFTPVREAVQQFQKTIPRFVDDFLAPEGTLTRKRALDERIERSNETIAARRETIRTLNEEIEHLGGTIENDRRTLEGMRLNRVQLTNGLQNARDAIERYRREAREQREQYAGIERAITREEEHAGSLKAQIASLESEQAAGSEREEVLRNERRELEGKIASENSSLALEDKRLKEKMQSLAGVQSGLEQLYLRRTEKRTEIRGLYEAFNEQHGRDLRELEDRDHSNEGNEKELRAEIGTLRESLRDLGSVNLMAVEEFEEVRDRYEFLTTQLQDLRDAREDLMEVTREIKRESEELFIETFNKIRKNFHTVFRRLFGGGRAELRLLDPDNVLESGIDILVQPPGKKLENIALLSGGERSLTAVALLFATSMVRSAPFTLLDEIDAALDEHNVTRFVEMLQEFASNSQYIVITHNKKTVAGASTLIGVTMQESGVSRIVGVRVDGEQPVPVGG